MDTVLQWFKYPNIKREKKYRLNQINLSLVAEINEKYIDVYWLNKK